MMLRSRCGYRGPAWHSGRNPSSSTMLDAMVRVVPCRCRRSFPRSRSSATQATPRRGRRSESPATGLFLPCVESRGVVAPELFVLNRRTLPACTSGACVSFYGRCLRALLPANSSRRPASPFLSRLVASLAGCVGISAKCTAKAKIAGVASRRRAAMIRCRSDTRRLPEGLGMKAVWLNKRAGFLGF